MKGAATCRVQEKSACRVCISLSSNGIYQTFLLLLLLLLLPPLWLPLLVLPIPMITPCCCCCTHRVIQFAVAWSNGQRSVAMGGLQGFEGAGNESAMMREGHAMTHALQKSTAATAEGILRAAHICSLQVTSTTLPISCVSHNSCDHLRWHDVPSCQLCGAQQAGIAARQRGGIHIVMPRHGAHLRGQRGSAHSTWGTLHASRGVGMAWRGM